MALPGAPAIRILADVADFSITAKPYLPQLYTLPSQFVDAALTSKAALANLYSETNPLVSGFAFSLVIAVIVLVAAEFNRNYSQVDRLWSILPTLYIWHFDVWARQSGVPHARLDLAVLWSTLWTTRLTYNYWRKGGYNKGSEDYRWAIIAKHIGPYAMFVLDVVFIAFIQSVLLFVVATPAYVLLLASRISPEITLPDVVFTGLILTILTIEFVADNQQWDYQTTKHKYLDTAKLPANSRYSQEDLDRGFNVSGLWAWSRHPNFACEMAIWITFYHWGAFASQTFINWTLTGTVAYVLIFMGSTPITEYISANKYPQYREYQRLVGMFVPGMLGGTFYKSTKKA